MNRFAKIEFSRSCGCESIWIYRSLNKHEVFYDNGVSNDSCYADTMSFQYYTAERNTDPPA